MTPDGEALTVDDLRGDKYDRARRLGWFDPDELAEERVLVVGAGAIGNETAKNLVLAGYRDITLVDMDRVEISNLSRCVFFRHEDDGRPKVEAVGKRAQAIEPEARIRTHDTRVQTLEDEIPDHDIILGCVDNVATRLYLNTVALTRSLPYIDASTRGMVGKVLPVWGLEHPCLECTVNRSHMDVLEERFSCTGRDVTFHDQPLPAEITTTSVVSAVQVREAVKASHGLSDERLETMFYYDGERNMSELFDVEVDPDCRSDHV